MVAATAAATLLINFSQDMAFVGGVSFLPQRTCGFRTLLSETETLRPASRPLEASIKASHTHFSASTMSICGLTLICGLASRHASRAVSRSSKGGARRSRGAVVTFVMSEVSPLMALPELARMKEAPVVQPMAPALLPTSSIRLASSAIAAFCLAEARAGLLAPFVAPQRASFGSSSRNAHSERSHRRRVGAWLLSCKAVPQYEVVPCSYDPAVQKVRIQLGLQVTARGRGRHGTVSDAIQRGISKDEREGRSLQHIRSPRRRGFRESRPYHRALSLLR